MAVALLVSVHVPLPHDLEIGADNSHYLDSSMAR
jgi:hypothetical protein